MNTKRIEDVPFEEVHEVQKYGTYYSDNRFWKKVERVAKKVGATVLLPVFTLYYTLQDEKVPVKHKAYIIGALGYFILPVDLIPDGILPVIGFTDDIAVMTLVINLIKDSITPEIKARANGRVAEIMGTYQVYRACILTRRLTLSGIQSVSLLFYRVFIVFFVIS